MTLILGLETSCDETAAAVVDQHRAVRSSVVATQHDLHQRYAGVVPEIASRAHLQRLYPVVAEALRDANLNTDQINAVAVGHRPGLVGSLIVGVAAAKALAWSLGLPLLGVDHVEAHLSAARLQSPGGSPQSAIGNPQSHIAFPALGLVVSGGHTSMYAMHTPRDLRRLGRTIDDAVGEAFDKAAVILGLGYPGGPAIDRLAQHGNPNAVKLPRPLMGKTSLDFSFSGLKTALLYAVRGHPVGRGKTATFQRDHTALSEQQKADFAASFQQAAVDTILTKLTRALHAPPQAASEERSDEESDFLRDAHEPFRALVVGGGVTANAALRQRLARFGEDHRLAVHLPDPDYCIDNAAMIAGHAHDLLEAGETSGLDLPVIATTRA